MDEFIKISKYAGMRIDLVQAGGGNTSVKIDNEHMLVKSSGFRLCDINENSGYTEINFKMLKNKLQINYLENKFDNYDYEKLLSDSIVLKNAFKPSIETFMHALTKRLTLHTHPTIVNMIMCQKNYKNILQEVFKDLNFYIIPYVTPGVKLAKEILKLKNFDDNDIQIVFMQNHGLIVSSDHCENIINTNEMILKKLESYLNIDYNKYHVQTNFTKYFFNKYVYLVDLKIENIHEFIYEFCPDNIVYIGEEIVIINNIDELENSKNLDDIKTIYFNGYLYIVANNLKKAKETEEVILNTYEILKYVNKKEILKFKNEEIFDILNRKDEKYRQSL